MAAGTSREELEGHSAGMAEAHLLVAVSTVAASTAIVGWG